MHSEPNVWQGKIGLTGGIASGKSTVTAMFAELGAAIIDADAIAHRIIEPDGPAYREVIAEFGAGICDADGRIVRERLRATVFHDARKRARMNGIMHPIVRREMLADYERIRSDNPERLIIHDIPLLIETGLYTSFTTTILVWIDRDTQIERLAARDAITPHEAARLLDMQRSLDEKRRLVNEIIDNSGPLEETREQVFRLFFTLQRGMA